MAELSTLARPYAKAAFESAVHASDLQGWADSLATMAALTQQASVIRLLNSPSSTSARQAEAVIEICGDALSEACQNFIVILSENRRITLLPQISQQFEIMKAGGSCFRNVMKIRPLLALVREPDQQGNPHTGKAAYWPQ